MSIHLAIDAIGNTHSGGATILLGLLNTIIQDNRITHVTVFTSPRARRDFDLPASTKIVECEQDLATTSYLRRMLWFERSLGRECQRLEVNTLLCLNGMGRGHRIPHITYLQQSLPFSPEALRLCSTSLRRKMRIVRAMMRRSCRTSNKVITQTPTMLTWITQQFNIRKSHCEALVPPALPLPECEHSAAISRQFEKVPANQRLLYVGSKDAYKNVELIARGLKRLRMVSPEATLFLTWPPDHPLCQQDGVVGLGYLDRCNLRTAYELSTLLVHPSLVESAPQPISEAMLLGIPLLLADRPYAHDVSGDAAVFFDPLSEQDFSTRAIDLMCDENKRHALTISGRILNQSREQNYHRLLDVLIYEVRH